MARHTLPGRKNRPGGKPADSCPGSLEIEIAAAILLVVLKIAWMIHEAQKVSHFQFWILNSLEFRVNEMNKKVRNIEKTLKKMEDKCD